MLLKTILIVTHYVIYLRSLLWSWFLAYSRPLALAFHRHTVHKIQSDAKTLDKLPIHLGILVVEDDISFTDIANIILWCMAMGISYVSIYDRNGVCKRQKNVIEKELKHQKDIILGDNSKYNTLSLHAGFCKQQEQQENGRLSEQTSVVLLDRHDGLPCMVSTARRLAAAVKHKHTSLDDITTTNVTRLLQGEEQTFPDPDLVIRFGETQCMMGYLPWQIRLTEILSLQSHHKFEYSSFYNALESYGKVEQRFGK